MSAGVLLGKSLNLLSLTVNGVQINGGGPPPPPVGGITIVESGKTIWTSLTNGQTVTLAAALPATGTYYVLVAWRAATPPVATPQAIGAQNPVGGDTTIIFDTGAPPAANSEFNWSVVRVV